MAGGPSIARSLDGVDPEPAGPPLRVLHCLYDVAGNAQGLAEAERELGLDSRCVVLRPGPLGFAVDEVLTGPGDGHARQEVARWRLLGRALAWADVVHLNFGRSIGPPWKGWGTTRRTAGTGPVAGLAGDLYLRATWLRDLPVLRAAGKAVFVTFQGDDARQGDVCRARYELSAAPYVEPGYYTPADDAAKRVAIGRFARYADGIFALNPDLLAVLPPGARFLPYASVDPRRWTARPVRADGGPPVVLHAPSHRGVKGTAMVLAALDELAARGVDFEFVLVEGVPHDRTVELYERADVLVDQLLVGWYGALAVELMALGRPVLCYLRPEDLAVLPEGMADELPVVPVTPTTLCDVLGAFLTVRRAELGPLGRRSRAFVERWHDPRAIAGQLEVEYRRAVAAHRPSPLTRALRVRSAQPLAPDAASGVQN